VLCGARVANVEIPNNKCIRYSLQYIFGVGDMTAQQILAATSVDPTRRTYELSEDDLASIRDEVEKLVVEGDLRRTISLNIKRCGPPCCILSEFTPNSTRFVRTVCWARDPKHAWDWHIRVALLCAVCEVAPRFVPGWRVFASAALCDNVCNMHFEMCSLVGDHRRLCSFLVRSVRALVSSGVILLHGPCMCGLKGDNELSACRCGGNAASCTLFMVRKQVQS
jgi:ribosomal protein S13